jgi:hypothetical protein
MAKSRGGDVVSAQADEFEGRREVKEEAPGADLVAVEDERAG